MNINRNLIDYYSEFNREIKFFLENIIGINFYQDQSEWKHKLIPMEVGKTNLDKVIDYWYTKIIMF